MGSCSADGPESLDLTGNTRTQSGGERRQTLHFSPPQFPHLHDGGHHVFQESWKDLRSSVQITSTVPCTGHPLPHLEKEDDHTTFSGCPEGRMTW